MLASKGAISIARPAMIAAAYFVAAAAMILLSRFDGGVASLWIATAPLVAELAIADRRRWPATIIGCLLASAAATSLFGFGWEAAMPLAFANIGEAVIGAALLRWIKRGDTYLDSLGGVLLFAGLAAAFASACVAVPAALAVSLLTHMSFRQEWITWFVGHTLGTLTFAPVATLVLTGELWRSIRQASVAKRSEAVALIGLMVATSLLVFFHQAPFLFLTMFPLMLVTFRLERAGAACAIVMLALIGGTLTNFGYGPINMMQGSSADHARLLQLYLAVTLMTVLPVAAQLKQRKDIFGRLLDSEARYKLITESSTDIIMTLDRDGVVQYASPSLLEITGFDPSLVLGRCPRELINGPDAAAVNDSYKRAFNQPEIPSIVEYRANIASGELKWFESHTRGIIGDDGNVTGWVSAIRDVSQRKSLELRLAHAATTDSLTGLANRRAFDSMLDRRINDRRAGKSGAYLAIFDIDFFKRVNDAHGHAVGDLVLETFAAAARRTLRASDFIARLGGEEFGVIVHAADQAQASAICDRLRRAVASDITNAPGDIQVAITVSAGIASIDGSLTRLQVMRAADQALYRAKASGRDQLAIAA